MANDIRTEDIFEMFENNASKAQKSDKKQTPSDFGKPKKSRKRKKRAHPWAFPLGLLIAMLSIIGAVTIIIAGVGSAKKALIKVKNIDEYNKLLVPVVMNDPDMFDDLSKADMGQLIDISIWAILKSDLAPDAYTYNDSGMVIPEEDVVKQFRKLFGSKIAPVHASVTGFGYEFTYDGASKCYTIPLTGVAPVYTPDVIDVEKKSNTVVLTVAYLAANGWAQSTDGKMVAPSPDKYVKITLREGDTGYYISAIQATSTPETAVTAPVTVIVETTQATTQSETTKQNSAASTSTAASASTTQSASTTAATQTATAKTETTTEPQTSIQ